MSRFSNRLRRAQLAGLLLGSVAACLAWGVVRDACGKDDPRAKAAAEAALERRAALQKSITWQTGPGVGKLGTVAEIAIPEGYRFTGQQGTAAFAELTENVPDPNQLGILMSCDDTPWYITFSYQDIGHVPDDEKASLDADAILKSLKQGNESANVYRRNKGWPEMTIVGWIRPPAYDQEIRRLVWAVRGRSEGEDVGNYDIRVLGRTGVMSVMLVADPNTMNATVPTTHQLLGKLEFTSGNKYSEWRAGDKVAQYGLVGLITGGAAAGAAKTGILAKLGMLIAKGGKAIIVGIAALLAGIWKVLTGRGRKSSSP